MTDRKAACIARKIGCLREKELVLGEISACITVVLPLGKVGLRGNDEQNAQQERNQQFFDTLDGIFLCGAFLQGIKRARAR